MFAIIAPMQTDDQQTEEALPDDLSGLRLFAQRQSRQIRLLLAKIAKLEEEQRLARALRFGSSSERGEPQYALFDEAEQHAEDTDLPEAETAIEVPAHTRKVARRKPLPADLPRVVHEHAPAVTR